MSLTTMTNPRRRRNKAERKTRASGRTPPRGYLREATAVVVVVVVVVGGGGGGGGERKLPTRYPVQWGMY